MAGFVLCKLFRCALGHQFTTVFTRFRAKVDEPIGGAYYIQVVFNDQHTVPCFLQKAQRAHQLGHIVKMQTGGGLIKHKQVTTLGHFLAAGSGLQVGQKASQFQALCFTTAERGHGLTQAQIIQTHLCKRLQCF